MSRPTTLPEKFVGLLLIATGLYGLFLGATAIIEGHVLQPSKLGTGQNVYLISSPLHFTIITCFFLFFGACFVRWGWRTFSGNIHHSSPDPVNVPTWLSPGSRITHQSLGGGTVTLVHRSDSVAIDFDLHGRKVIALDTGLALIRSELVST